MGSEPLIKYEATLGRNRLAQSATPKDRHRPHAAFHRQAEGITSHQPPPVEEPETRAKNLHLAPRLKRRFETLPRAHTENRWELYKASSERHQRRRPLRTPKKRKGEGITLSICDVTAQERRETPPCRTDTPDQDPPTADRTNHAGGPNQNTEQDDGEEEYERNGAKYKEEEERDPDYHARHRRSPEPVETSKREEL
ncbi:unnamed protein product [Brassica oleracea]